MRIGIIGSVSVGSSLARLGIRKVHTHVMIGS
jgi:hypothetical protein